MASKFMEEVRRILRLHRYSFQTEKTYSQWIRRFIIFHGKRHPRDMGAPELEAFLSYLASSEKVSASTQNQAVSALLFLYQKVLRHDLPWMQDVVRAKRPLRVPIVLTSEEVRRVLDAMGGKLWLMASLLYGSGLRLVECLRLRVQDIDYEYLQITVREGKGGKDRRTIVPEKLIPHIKQQLAHVRSVFEQDRVNELAGVSMPFAVDRKYVGASRQWKWQYVFPSMHYAYIHYHQEKRRHHSHPSGLQRAVIIAVTEAGIDKHATSHTFRHSFATHLLENG